MSSVAPSEVTSGRKRVLSTTGEPTPKRRRPHMSSTSSFPFQLPGEPPSSRSTVIERLPPSRSRSLYIEAHGPSETSILRSRASLPVRSASFTAFSFPNTPVIPSYQDHYGSGINEGLSMLRRSISMTMSETSTISYPETSAYHFLRNSKATIDFMPPSTERPSPIALSSQNLLFFTRGIRVYHKSILSGESGDIVSQLCRVPETLGHLRGISCGGVGYSNNVALGTGKGYVQIYDVSTKKITVKWSTKDLACMAWNGPVLSVGTVKGTIRHFDLRIKEGPKMKEQAKNVTRHQTRINSLAWNEDGKMMASGDENGIIFCWDPRQRAPLDAGEMVQRRRKMQHPGAITALAWCPWKPKILASGDSSADGKGTLRIWNVVSESSSSVSSASSPDKRELDAQITSLHWSPTCKELLTTHRSGHSSLVSEPQTQIQPQGAAFITVHSYPSLRQVVSVPVSSGGLDGSVLSSNGTKLVMTFPEEGKLHIWDAWGKNREVKRQPSFMDRDTIR